MNGDCCQENRGTRVQGCSGRAIQPIALINRDGRRSDRAEARWAFESHPLLYEDRKTNNLVDG